MNIDTQIASLLSARICHDLVSPVGAVVNGVGLVQEIAGPSLNDELSMIGQSAGRASSLLQFYRIAFGPAGEDAVEVARSAVHMHADSLVASQKVTFEMTGVEGPPLPRILAKFFCLQILCAKSLVGLRGAVYAMLDPVARPRLQVSVHASGMIANPDFLEVLQAPVDLGTIPPRAVEFLLLKAAIDQTDATIDLDINTDIVTITVNAA